MEQVRIEDVDLSEIEDGSYTGVSDSGVIKVEVEGIVRDHRIEEIRLLKHRSDRARMRKPSLLILCNSRK
jgi:uncharacterized protein with FMN-binding domain